VDDFEVVPPDEVPTARGPGRGPSALSLALESGATVFVAGKNEYDVHGIRGKRAYLTTRGHKVSIRRGERNGVVGVFIWVVPSENGKHP
jgi:hypothetical protein